MGRHQRAGLFLPSPVPPSPLSPWFEALAYLLLVLKVVHEGVEARGAAGHSWSPACASAAGQVAQLFAHHLQVPVDVGAKGRAVPSPRSELELALVDSLDCPHSHRVHECGVPLAKCDLKGLTVKNENYPTYFKDGM